MMRSATSVAANYGEVRGAESREDFIHKLRIVQKELNEPSIWLIVSKSSNVKPEFISALVAENRDPGRVITASIHTSRNNQTPHKE